MNFLKWLLKSVGPYVVGILIGIGFAYLLVDLLSNPLSLPGQAVQSQKSAVTKESAPASKPAHAAESAKPAAPKPAAKAEEPPPPPPAPVKVAEAAPPPPPAPAPAPVKAEEPAPAPMKIADVPPPAPAMEPAAASSEPAPATEEAASAPAPAAPWSQPAYGQPPQAMAQPPAEVVAKCGQQPRTPGYAMSRYYSCLWQQQCEARQARALEMIRRSKEACPKSGANAQLCQNYYASLEQQYQSGMCPQQWNQNPPAGQPGGAAPQAEQPAAAPQGGM